MRLALSLLAVLALPVTAGAAGFDCRKASTSIEKMICGDPKLSELDDRLMAAYKAALGTGSADTIKADQRTWLTTVRNKCTDARCLEQAYATRLQALSSGPVQASQGSQTGTYKCEGGELLVENRPDGSIRFEVSASNGMNVGGASGRAMLKDGVAIYSNRDDDCTLVIRFAKNEAKIAQDGSCGMGLNVTAEGVYKLAKAGRPKFSEAEQEARAQAQQSSGPRQQAKAPEPSVAASSEDDFDKALLAKNAARISALKLPKELVAAKLMLRRDVLNQEPSLIALIMGLDNWLALAFENPQIAVSKAIEYKRTNGILVKEAGMAQPYGFLFELHNGKAYPIYFVQGDDVMNIESIYEATEVAEKMLQIASGGHMAFALSLQGKSR